jgi:transcriptional regulator with XRE-family HTH domain
MQDHTWFDNELAEMEDDLDFLTEMMAFDYVNEIRRVMKEERITQAELARRIGKSRAYISKVMNYSPNLTIKSLAAIALALNIRLRWTRPRLADKKFINRLDTIVISSNCYIQMKTAGDEIISYIMPTVVAKENNVADFHKMKLQEKDYESAISIAA